MTWDLSKRKLPSLLQVGSGHRAPLIRTKHHSILPPNNNTMATLYRLFRAP
jgi:hypothetical protein